MTPILVNAEQWPYEVQGWPVRVKRIRSDACEIEIDYGNGLWSFPQDGILAELLWSIDGGERDSAKLAGRAATIRRQSAEIARLRGEIERLNQTIADLCQEKAAHVPPVDVECGMWTMGYDGGGLEGT